MRIRCSILSILFVFLAAISAFGATGDLLSIKKGNSNDKAWAVFYFEDSVPWVGVSQPASDKLSIYFNGRCSTLRESIVSLDDRLQRSIYVQTLRQNPPICRIDVLFEADIPLGLVKNENLLVLSLNDDRVPTESTESQSEFGKTSAALDVSQIVEDDKARTSVTFDQRFEWIGFVRHNRNNPKLIFKNVRSQLTEEEVWYDEGELSNIIFQVDPSSKNISSVHLNFSQDAVYSIAQKDNELMIETSASVTELIASEEAVATMTDNLGTMITVTDDPAPMPLATSTQSAESSPFQASPQALPPIRASQEKTQFTAVSEDDLLTQQATMGDLDDAQSVINDGFQSQHNNSEPSGIQQAAEPDAKTMVNHASDFIPWDELVSFDFRATPVTDALRTIAVMYDLNMVIAGGVDGDVTLNLKDISLKRALEKIIHIHNCEYVVEDDIITVKPVQVYYKGAMVTRIYRLKYADATNLKNVIGQIASSDSLVQVFHPEFLNYEVAGQNRRDYNKVAVQGIRRASILIVTDSFDKIQEIDQVIAELDRAPAQILIKSKLVEMSPEYVQNLGIDWERSLGLFTNSNKSPDGNESSLRITNIGQESEPFDFQKSLNLGQITNTQYLAMLDFLQEETDSKLISNPSLLAMDNEEASISVGTTVPIPRIQRGSGGQGDMVTFEYKEVNIQLNVSPHISNENEIIMFINPVIEEITGWVEVGVSRAPITAKRTVNSIVTVQNGATLVVGGLIKTQRTKIIKKVWLLGSIPLIGPLFQHEQFQDRETNLLIFITPQIMTS